MAGRRSPTECDDERRGSGFGAGDGDGHGSVASAGLPGPVRPHQVSGHGVAASSSPGCGIPAELGGGVTGRTGGREVLAATETRDPGHERDRSPSVLYRARGRPQAARDSEYEEILDKCRDFHAGLEKEYAASHFTFGELEENEVELVKLNNWFAKVQARDVFGAPLMSGTRETLARCALALEAYAGRVFEEETDDEG